MKILLRNILRLLRPRQWMKNVAIFAAIMFSGQLFNLSSLLQVIYGFLIFCALSSSTYIINDIFDREQDRLHPFKRLRPLASGEVPLWLAMMLSAVLLTGSLIASLLVISPAFFVLSIMFFSLMLLYTILLKHIEIIDILTLAGGYILRVYAGEVVTTVHISAWLFLTTISLSLFLAIGKRRSELTLLSSQEGKTPVATRKTLSHYNERMLDVYLSVFATSTFISYALFTFLENPRGTLIGNDVLNSLLPVNLQKKWLMVTIVLVVYGLMRYLQRIYEKHEGESPERVLFSDRPLLTAVVTWGITVIIVIYFIKP